MARKLRVEYPGAIYHVMNRGDRREVICVDDQDRRGLLAALEEGKTGRAVADGDDGDDQMDCGTIAPTPVDVLKPPDVLAAAPTNKNWRQMTNTIKLGTDPFPASAAS